MASQLDLVISNNKVNRFGFRVLTEGIRTENYMTNPVVLAYHEERLVSVAKAIALTKSPDGEFSAKIDFDENDPFAMLIYNKYKNGYMSATSMGLLRLVESCDERDLMPGQSFPTVVESEMLEMSLVNVPGNAECTVKLYNAELKEIKLSLIETNPNPKPMSKEEKTVEQLQAENLALKKDRAKNLVQLHVKRGAIEAGETEFFEKSAEHDYDGTKVVLEMRPDKKADGADKQALADQLVELHFTRGGITAEEKEFFKKSAVLDYDGAKKVLEARKGKDAVDQFLGTPRGDNAAAADTNDRSKWTYLDFYKKDHASLLKLKAESRDKYNTLLNDHKQALRAAGKVVVDEEIED